MLFFLPFVPVMCILIMFSWGQCCVSPARVFFTILLGYFTVKLLLRQSLLLIPFLSFNQNIFQFFLRFFPFSVNFFANNYTSFMKWYSHFYLSHYFFCFLFQWYLSFLAFIPLCYRYPFVCCCSHVVCDPSFSFIVNLFETFQISVSFVSL